MLALITDAAGYRFDVRQFRRMMIAGIFEDQKVELVAGKIYVMTDLPPHTFAVGRYHGVLRSMLPQDAWTIREEKPVMIGHTGHPSLTFRCCVAATSSTPPGTRDPGCHVAGRGCRHDLPARSRSEMASLRRGWHSDLHHCPSQGPRHARRGIDRPHGPGRRARYTDVIRYSTGR